MGNLISADKIYWRSDNDSGYEVLNNINLELKRNDFVVLRGPAGSGKTTLLKILCGRLRPSSGVLKYGEKNAGQVADPELKRIVSTIGYIPEEPVFMEKKNLYHNVEYALKLHNTPSGIIFDRALHFLKLTNLLSRRDVAPENLSSLERKNLALTMVLASEPAIMMCDLNMTGREDEDDMLRVLKNTTYRGSAVIATARPSSEVKSVRVKYIDIEDGKIK
ncbi:MAG: ATP-binding cassette domain-containing protein [Elusimicrobiota bacterium]